MSSYVTTQRGHDAEWLLGQEIALNQAILAAGQRRGRKNRGGERSADMWLHSTPSTSDEADAAAEVLRQRASAAGISEEKVAEVLTILGLTPELAPAVAPARNRPGRASGWCHECGRGSIHLRVDGTLVAHSRHSNRPASDVGCPGSGTLPRQPEKGSA